MLEVITGFVKINLETEDFVRVMNGLNLMGHKSIVWQSKMTMLSEAGITELDSEILSWIGYYRLREDNYFNYRADLVVDDKNVIYFINHRQWLSGSGRIEIGIITDKPLEAISRMGKYAKAFTKALKTEIDGRRVRHMNLKWYFSNESDKITTHVMFYKNFSFPIFDSEDLKAAKYLMDHRRRELLRRIAESGSLMESTIQGKEKNLVLELLQDLINNGLATKRYIVTCRKRSVPICVVQSKEELTSEIDKALTCPHCGAIFSKELLQNSFVLSQLGAKLSKSSYWMMVVVTYFLIENGIPEKNIIWNLSDASEEIDCAVQFKDKVWIFELKDRNFEAGDAHPLMYRTVKFKASKAIIITTGKVSKDARNVFEELSSRKNSVFSNGYPLYIEGLSSVNDALAKLIKNETLLNVLNKSKQISQAATIDFSPIFVKLFGKYLIEKEGKISEHAMNRYF